MLSIGEFSQVTRLTVKTLRYYHELGILTPVRVDKMTGYRYYDELSYDRAYSIIKLKNLGFSLQEIKTILEECETEEDLPRFIRRKKEDLHDQVSALKQLESKLSVLEQQLEAIPENTPARIEEVTLDLPCVAVLPLKGRYDELGKAYRRLYKIVGPYTTGKPYCFYYNMEYREENAEMEAAVEVTREVRKEGLQCRRIVNLHAVKLVHRGPYGGQGNTYMKLYDYCHTKGYTPVPPIIEHYIKGPGIVLRGDPKNYLTECILPVSREQ